MAFQEFQRKRTHSGEPAISITKYGNFILNATTVSKFFDGNKYAKLYWDPDQRKIGIKPLKTKDEYSYMVNLSPKGSVGALSGTAFFKTYGIKYDKTRSFGAVWNEKEGLLEVKVD
jgi:hypothetical protein